MNYEYLAWGSAGLSALLLLVVIWLFLRIRHTDRVRRELLLDEEPQKVDDALAKHNKSIKKLKEQVVELKKFFEELSAANRKNFQRIGFIRFNPFDDAGGSISFVLAVLDDHNNGVVISSLHGREGDRVYAKEIKAGESKTPLTEEEKMAIQQAV